MKCEEFEAIGLDGGRDASLSDLERFAAREHASTCSRCGAISSRTLVAPVGIAIMLAIAVLYAVFQRYW